MRYEKQISATTHVDTNHCQLTKESLENAAKQHKKFYIPITIEHDPRIPPVGRVESAEVVELEDGEWGLEGTCAYFEEGDEDIPVTDGKTLVIERENPKRFKVMYDFSYDTPEGREVIKKLSEISGEKASLGIKRGLDPISILTIVVGFIAVNYAIGFLQKLGSDDVDKLKKILADYFKNKSGKERLLHWIMRTGINGQSVELGVIATNPDSNSINRFIETGLGNLDGALEKLNIEPNLARIVFEYKDGKLSHLYALRKDGITLILKKK